MSAEDDILRADDARYLALYAGDVAALEEILTPDFTYVHRNGLSDTRDEYLQRLRTREVTYRDGRREDVRVRVFREYAAIMTGRLRMWIDFANGRPSIELNNVFIAVWIRFDDRWRQVAWNSTGIGGS